MTMMIAILFALALLGFQQLVRFFKGSQYLSWLLAIIIQSLVVYIFALAHQLRLGIWLTFISGLTMAVIFSVVRLKQRPLVKMNLHLFDVWFIIFGILISLTLLKSPLIHYDNFTHWATMVKYLTFVGELPSAQQNLVTFTDYPPITAMFLTYLSTIVGYHEGSLLVGQFMIIGAGLYTLFGVLRDQRRALITAGLVFMLTLINIFNIAIRFNNLLVDCLIAILAIAGISAVYIHRDQRGWQIVSTSLIVNFLLLTKSSAMYFAILILIYFAIANFARIKNKAPKWREGIKTTAVIILTTAGSFIGWLMWRVHVANVFTKVSKHALNLQAYQSQVDHESANTQKLIVQKFMSYMTNTDTLFFRGILLVNIALLLTWLVIRVGLHKRSYSLIMLAITDLVTTIYVIGVLGMYVVSMPYAEAINLAGIDRYLSTIVIFSILLSGVIILNDIDRASFQPIVTQRYSASFANLQTKQVYQESTFFLLIFSSVLMLSEINGINFLNHQMNQELPIKMQQMVPNQNKFNHKRILLVDAKAQDVNNAYANYVGRYYLFSDHVDGREAFDVSTEKFQSIMQGYQYIVVPRYHQTFSKLADKTYHEHVRTGIYKVTNNGIKQLSTTKYLAEMNQ